MLHYFCSTKNDMQSGICLHIQNMLWVQLLNWFLKETSQLEKAANDPQYWLANNGLKSAIKQKHNHLCATLHFCLQELNIHEAQGALKSFDFPLFSPFIGLDLA